MLNQAAIAAAIAASVGSVAPLVSNMITAGSGVYTMNAATKRIKLTIVGGGSGGGSASVATQSGTGGAAGETIIAELFVSPLTAFNYSVGVAGVARPQNGGLPLMGGNTSFGALVAFGGNASGVNTAQITSALGGVLVVGGAGGSLQIGNVAGLPGAAPGYAVSDANSTGSSGGAAGGGHAGGGAGGSSVLGVGGVGGAGGAVTGAAGAAGVGYGAGGGGGGAGSVNCGAGGAGVDGVIIVNEYSS